MKIAAYEPPGLLVECQFRRVGWDPSPPLCWSGTYPHHQPAA